MLSIQELFESNAKKLGLATLFLQTMEECGELVKAISKWRRVNGIGQKTETPKKEAFDKLIEEITDVEICIGQIKYLMGPEARPYFQYAKKKALDKVAERYKDEPERARL